MTVTVEKLPHLDPNGEEYEAYQQMANLLNALRAEHRTMGEHTETVKLGGVYRFIDRRDHEVWFSWEHPGAGFVGVYNENISFDGVDLGGRAHNEYTDADGNKQPGWASKKFFGWKGYPF